MARNDFDPGSAEKWFNTFTAAFRKVLSMGFMPVVIALAALILLKMFLSISGPMNTG